MLFREIQLKHHGGGEEEVVWSEVEGESQGPLSLDPAGVITIRGVGDVSVRVQLKKYPHVKAVGR